MIQRNVCNFIMLNLGLPVVCFRFLLLRRGGTYMSVEPGR
jgi:hypothetical protein